jgi:hypothetical protein
MLHRYILKNPWGILEISRGAYHGTKFSKLNLHNANERKHSDSDKIRCCTGSSSLRFHNELFLKTVLYLKIDLLPKYPQSIL